MLDLQSPIVPLTVYSILEMKQGNIIKRVDHHKHLNVSPTLKMKVSKQKYT